LNTEALSEKYKDYIAARKLVPEEVWKNYVLMGIRDLKEQIILRKAIEALRKKVYEVKRKYMEQLKKGRQDAKKEKSEYKIAEKTTQRMYSKRKRKSSTPSDS